MQRPSRITQWIVWGGLALTVALIGTAFFRERLAAGRAAVLPVLFEVAPFALTNQAGRLVATEELRGKVWLADVIFTRCAGPCPRMSGLMADLQKAVPGTAPVRFVSLTTDPEHDTPEVLARYARRFGADLSRWQFLTGTAGQVKQAAVTSLKFTALPKDEGKQESSTDLFIHSTVFVLVDKRGQVRGVFEADDPGARERILSAVELLVAE